MPLVLVFAQSQACKSGTDDGGGGIGAAGGGGGNAQQPDADGDGISDVDEGSGAVDSDGDTTPDSLDADSDGDGIPDAVEGGDADTNTPPVDSDADGTPDFRDLDSDDNGIADAVEGGDDLDGDGTGSYADLDNDGDLVPDVDEIAGAGSDSDGNGSADPLGSPDQPADGDGDGTPNYLDLDSDGDTIADGQEGGVDTDQDAFLDRYDLDSDNDGFTDAEEAGDADLLTPPIDSDQDGTPNYLDPDSDNDGVSDLLEHGAGSDPTQGDSDNDGVSDLVEVAAGTDPNDPADNPQAHGNFVFIVPYQQPTTPPKDTLHFRTSVQYADIYFSFDTTGSMSAELTAMSNAATGVPAIIDALQCKPDPASTTCSIDSDCPTNYVCFTGACVDDPLVANGGDGCIPDMWTGAGRFDNCNTYRNLQHVQANPALTAAAIPTTTGGGSAEAVVQAAACVANEAICTNANQCSADPTVVGPIGCPGYRPEAVRMLVQITDADNQGGTCSGSVSSVQTSGDALQGADIKFISLYGTGDDCNNASSPTCSTLCTTTQSCASQIGVASGTVDQNNNPFVYPALDAAVVGATVQAVLDIARGVPLDVTIDATDDPADAVDALQFIAFLEVNLSGGSCTNVSPVADSNADGHDDEFPALLGGTPVCWDVNPVPQNTTVQPTDAPQLYRAILTVRGDGSPLDSRSVYFLIPPKPAEIPPPPA
ncbi:MAG: hypothetical protein IT373_00625 [Polyangiaceae bacterium]|nr:hypothetical protein [Polyangiaceae bacterium]